MPQNSQISRAAAILKGGGPVFWKPGTENAIAPRPLFLPQKFTDVQDPKLSTEIYACKKKEIHFFFFKLAFMHKLNPQIHENCTVSELLKTEQSTTQKPQYPK